MLSPHQYQFQNMFHQILVGLFQHLLLFHHRNRAQEMHCNALRDGIYTFLPQCHSTYGLLGPKWHGSGR